MLNKIAWIFAIFSFIYAIISFFQSQWLFAIWSLILSLFFVYISKEITEINAALISHRIDMQWTNSKLIDSEKRISDLESKIAELEKQLSELQNQNRDKGDL